MENGLIINMEKNVINILKKVGAIITNSHIVLTSGRHTDAYINPDMLLPQAKEVSRVAKIFAGAFKTKNIDVVVGPAIGGIVISTWVAYHLSKLKRKNILGIFTEKTPENDQVFDRGFEKLVKGKNILVVEDITTTGGSAKKAANSVKKAGGKVVAVSVIVNRDAKNVTSKTVGYPFKPLAVMKIDSFAEKDCPLCKKNIPINIEVGHGKEYLSKLNKS